MDNFRKDDLSFFIERHLPFPVSFLISFFIDLRPNRGRKQNQRNSNISVPLKWDELNN